MRNKMVRMDLDNAPSDTGTGAIIARAKAAGLTVTELCRRSNIARSTLFRWETGATGPLLENHQRLVAVVEQAEAERQAEDA